MERASDAWIAVLQSIPALGLAISRVEKVFYRDDEELPAYLQNPLLQQPTVLGIKNVQPWVLLEGAVRQSTMLLYVYKLDCCNNEPRSQLPISVPSTPRNLQVSSVTPSDFPSDAPSGMPSEMPSTSNVPFIGGTINFDDLIEDQPITTYHGLIWTNFFVSSTTPSAPSPPLAAIPAQTTSSVSLDNGTFSLTSVDLAGAKNVVPVIIRGFDSDGIQTISKTVPLTINYTTTDLADFENLSRVEFEFNVANASGIDNLVFAGSQPSVSSIPSDMPSPAPPQSSASDFPSDAPSDMPSETPSTSIVPCTGGTINFDDLIQNEPITTYRGLIWTNFKVSSTSPSPPSPPRAAIPTATTSSVSLADGTFSLLSVDLAGLGSASPVIIRGFDSDGIENISKTVYFTGAYETYDLSQFENLSRVEFEFGIANASGIDNLVFAGSQPCAESPIPTDMPSPAPPQSVASDFPSDAPSDMPSETPSTSIVPCTGGTINFDDLIQNEPITTYRGLIWTNFYVSSTSPSPPSPPRAAIPNAPTSSVSMENGTFSLLSVNLAGLGSASPVTIRGFDSDGIQTISKTVYFTVFYETYDLSQFENLSRVEFEFGIANASGIDNLVLAGSQPTTSPGAPSRPRAAVPSAPMSS
eukprot:scaffold5780_cov102-Cylindrotheca_fusiformis.AAC.1